MPGRFVSSVNLDTVKLTFNIDLMYGFYMGTLVRARYSSLKERVVNSDYHL